MSSDDRSERLLQASREQFEALGRFVQAFEQMVFYIRSGVEGRLQMESQNMVYFTRMIFHHSALGAWSLWEILRAVIYTDVTIINPVSPSDANAFNSILGRVGTEIADLVKMRNDILHGTPFIGHVGAEEEDFSKFRIMKWGVAASGWKAKDTPETVADLLALVERCKRVSQTVLMVRFASLASPPEERAATLNKAVETFEGRAPI